jgi:hypothetical protein
VGEFFEHAGAAMASARLAAQTAVRSIPLPSQGRALFGKCYCRKTRANAVTLPGCVATLGLKAIPS